ncbi:hypothetical protein SLA2020_348290 [Shorea laevis]
MAAFEDFPISHWIKVILDPLKFLAIPKKDIRRFQLFAIITMDLIWFSRNQVVHNSQKLEVTSLLKQIKSALKAHEQA